MYAMFAAMLLIYGHTLYYTLKFRNHALLDEFAKSKSVKKSQKQKLAKLKNV